jgi:hypothetical protein
MVEHKYNIAGAVITYHDGSRITSFVHTDNQGSIVATTNYLGVVQTQALYEPFGTQSIVYEVPVYGTNNYYRERLYWPSADGSCGEYPYEWSDL